MKHLTGIVFLMLFLAVQPVSAQGLNEKAMYFGGGINQNDLSGADDATGFQFFAGYDLPVKVPNGKLSVEVGYWDSGDFDIEFFGVTVASESANGIWATGVYSLQLNKTVDLLGRLGFDFGDDDGFMIGIGVGFNLNRNMQIRGEFVSRDNIDSLQANFVFHL